MIDYVFGREEDTIEVCSGSVNGECFTVDVNPETNPRIVDDGQTLAKIPSNSFNRWRCDPPYNKDTAKKMYGTDLPISIRLLEAATSLPIRVFAIGIKRTIKQPSNPQQDFGYIDVTFSSNETLPNAAHPVSTATVLEGYVAKQIPKLHS